MMKVWFHYGYYYYTEMLLFVQCNKLFSSLHGKWKEDICFYTSLYLTENLHSCRPRDGASQ